MCVNQVPNAIKGKKTEEKMSKIRKTFHINGGSKSKSAEMGRRGRFKTAWMGDSRKQNRFGPMNLYSKPQEHADFVGGPAAKDSNKSGLKK
jgi:hypothetical protein